MRRIPESSEEDKQDFGPEGRFSKVNGKAKNLSCIPLRNKNGAMQNINLCIWAFGAFWNLFLKIARSMKVVLKGNVGKGDQH